MKKTLFKSIILSLVTSFCFADLNNVNITGLDGRPGVYNSNEETASLDESGYRTFYSDVVEYSRAVTPPNIENPRLKFFATMPNPLYSPDASKRMGAQKKTIKLYGIPQDSTEVNEEPVVTLEDNKKENETFKIYGATGQYNRSAKTAYLIDVRGKKIEYTNVVEYSQAVTPPSISNPKLKPFAIISNPKYQETGRKFGGGQAKHVTLYGIEKGSDENIIAIEDEINTEIK